MASSANSHTHPDQHDDKHQNGLDRPGPRYLRALSASMSGTGTERNNGSIRPSRLPTMAPTFQFQLDPASNDSTASSATLPGELEKHNSGLLQIPKPRRPGLATRVSWAASEVWENHVDELNFPRCMYHLISAMWLCVMLYLTWWLLPVRGHWASMRQPDRVPHHVLDMSNYFNSFQGYSECNIRAADLYQRLGQDVSEVSHDGYCARRKDLLEAMSSGGRVGFDAPYFPRGCHYRWYSVPEICMILERFQAIVFIGDESLQTIYAGLNILLRQDLSHGALKTWDMDKVTLRQCGCDNQFTSKTCTEHFVTSSDDMKSAPSGKLTSPYLCTRTPHAFLPISTSPASQFTITKFKTLVPRLKRSTYHPIPIIHALSPSTPTAQTATASLEEFLTLADQSHRKTPMLWIGPTASGHTEIRGRKGNQEIWDFDAQVRRVAEVNDVEVLGMWNMSMQAGSWDGVRFGERVAVTQAMMVVNWLARLESS
ncbi:hypothetical protein H2200_012360 [Cladophialophora chaetospira]|uniref:Uncharacterized protein n=1 Tax=Cladophialophora chaetospira TaxID=386627 RepID=A0AA39CCD9_9EURO|nr:hypothetical protein H2200_012360 [Cladophialophora chaetospira]